MVTDDDLKILARQRREMRLKAAKEGYDYGTRAIPKSTVYRRKPKHMPRDWDSWEEVYD